MYLIHSEAIFYVTLLVCLFLVPEGLRWSLSYFGVHRNTVVLFAAGITASAYLLLKAATRLSRRNDLRILRIELRIVALSMLVAVVVPSIHGWPAQVHAIASETLFITQALFSFWLLRQFAR